MGHHGTGVVILDAAGALVLRNAAAHSAMDDLGSAAGADHAPDPIRRAAALLADACAAVDGCDPEVVVRARGRSGTGYELRASRAEPNDAGETRILVTISQTSLLLHGLTPREREVVGLAARGASTKSIAAMLGLSPYTVQEHVGNACQKVGVRGRRALLARIFLDPAAAGEAALPDLTR